MVTSYNRSKPILIVANTNSKEPLLILNFQKKSILVADGSSGNPKSSLTSYCGSDISEG